MTEKKIDGPGDKETSKVKLDFTQSVNESKPVEEKRHAVVRALQTLNKALNQLGDNLRDLSQELDIDLNGKTNLNDGLVLLESLHYATTHEILGLLGKEGNGKEGILSIKAPGLFYDKEEFDERLNRFKFLEDRDPWFDSGTSILDSDELDSESIENKRDQSLNAPLIGPKQ